MEEQVHYLKKELYQLIQSDESIFDFIQDSAMDGMWYWDLENPENEWMSASFWRTLGYDPAQMPHKASSWQHLINPDDLKSAVANLQKHCADPSYPYDQVVRYLHCNGSVVWVRCRGVAIRDDNGRPYRMLGSHHEITEQKRTEIALENAVKRYTSILDAQSTYVVRINLQGYYTYANEKFYLDFNTTSQKTIGFHSIDDVADQDRAQCQHTANKCIQNPGKTFPVTLRKFVEGKGEVVTQWDFISITDQHGAPFEIQCVGYDITRRVQAESELQEKKLELEGFFNTTPDLFCIASTDGRLLKLNQSWVSVLGYELAELQGQAFINFIHPDDLEESLNALINLGTTTGVIQLRNRMKHKQGEYISLEWRATFREGLIYASVRDITADLARSSRIAESEALLSSFYNNAPMMMGIVEIVNRDIIHIRDNNLSLQFFGRSAEEMENRRASDVGVPRETIDLWITHYEAAEKNGTPSRFEYQNEYGGVTRYLSVTATFIGLMPTGRKRYAYIVHDISSKKKAEERANTTERKYQELLNTIPIGVFECIIMPDQSIYFTFVSPKWSEITGLSEVDVMLKPDLAISQIYPEDLHHFRAVFNQALDDGMPIKWEGRKIVRGETRYVLIQSSVKKRQDGSLLINGIEKDITERKVAEQLLTATKIELERRTMELDMTLGASGIGLWEIDLLNDNLYWDKHLRKLFQNDEEHLNYESWRSMVHPDDVGEVEETFAAFLRNEKPYDVEYRVVLRDGTTRYHNSKGIAFMNSTGKISRVKGISADITVRKEMELELLKTQWVLGQTSTLARVGGWEYDLRRNNIFWSSVTKEIFGLPDNFQPEPGNHLNCFAAGEDREKISLALDNAIRNGEPWNIELRGLHTDGRVIWVRSIGKPEFVNGNCRRVMGAIQDIQVLKEAEEKMMLAQRQAEAGSRAKSEFLSNMSHEIRTPLNGVIGFSDLMMKTTLDAAQREYMSTLYCSATSLLDIINDILDFSKIEAGKLELCLQQTDIFRLAEEVVDIIKYPAHQKDIELLVNIDPALPQVVVTDEVRLRQILINLLSNAAKFTHEGEIELRVEAREVLADGHYTIRFSVRDTGIGIAPQNQQKIFDAFSQEDGSVSRRFGGTGLGLTISNKLLGLMGSSLLLESEPGKGSTFFFDIAVKAARDKSARTVIYPPVKKVLVVDDNMRNRVILRRMLHEQKIAADEASDGVEALQMMEKQKYDVVILDYKMPYLTGTGTVRKMRESEAHPAGKEPVILLYSSADDKEVEQECNDLDIRNRLTKPVKRQQLVEALVNLRLSPGQKEISPDETLNSREDVTVLIADDNPTNLLLTRSILKKIDPSMKVVEAANGADAVTKFIGELPDIVFMDIQMPVKSGYEAVRDIRRTAHGKNVPVIALTAGTLKGEREKCIAAGMNDYLSKPVVKDSIEKMIRQWLPGKNKAPGNAGVIDAPIDLSRLRDTFENDEDTVAKILRLAKLELLQALDLIKGNNRDNTTLIRAAHKMKGTAQNIYSHALVDAALSVEQNPEGDLEVRLAKIESECDSILRFIEKVTGS